MFQTEVGDKNQTHIFMFNNFFFNKVFIIQQMVISGRALNTFLITNTEGDGVTQDYHNFLFFEDRSFFKITWKKYCAAEQATNDTIIWRLCIA
jgi:hypothetical protein